MHLRPPRPLFNLIAGTAVAAMAVGGPPVAASSPQRPSTPIQHVVVIFGENVSFDHYFGTYPDAANTDGQPFAARPGTPSVNGLTAALLTANPNGVNPRRYDPASVADLVTCDQDHNYNDEQRAADGGLMDRFPATVGNGTSTSPEGAKCVAGDVMNYYDGNTVTALWNYAQNFAMSDNSFNTTYGPSAPGAINLVSGDTGNVDTSHEVNSPSIATTTSPNADLTPDGLGGYSLTSDAQPYWDDCSTRDAVALNGTNVGDELNARGLSWGWFQGGFRPTEPFAAAAPAVGESGQATATFIADEFKSAGFQSLVPHSANQGICDAVTPVGVALGGTGQYGYKDDYIAHHEPFQYYASTANPHHLTVPTDSAGNDTLAGLKSVGRDSQHYVAGVPQFDTPNHQYGMTDFDSLVAAIHKGKLPASALPAVSFLKAPGYEDGHAGYSDPIDEQKFVVDEINALEATPDWSSTAVIISYDDSDGWYDHVYPGVANPSATVADAVTGTGACGTGTPLADEQGRCGYGPRLPLLVVSPWARTNAVNHTVTDQSSILRFVEDNWHLGRIPGSFDTIAGSLNGLFDFDGRRSGEPPHDRKLFLSPATGQPLAHRG
jgi:phospholipase C